MMDNLVLQVLYKNKLTCPNCGATQTVKMLALEVCSVYQCNTCKEIIQAHTNECCVYCEYGEVKCPSEQVKWN